LDQPPPQSSVFVQPMTRFEHRPLEPDNVRPRRTAFSFPNSIPKHWLAGDVVQTHFFNAINLFVVSFEDFMGRVMRARLPQLREQNPAFERQVRGFMGQEATHSFVHAKYLQNIKEHGFQVDDYLARCEHVFSHWFERRLGTPLCLATIAGFEHLTSVLAEIILSGRMLKRADPVMAEVWEWHAAEEIEHKTLAFDLLKATHPSFLLRLPNEDLKAVEYARFVDDLRAMLTESRERIVEVVNGDWASLSDHGPFSLLFLDVREAKRSGADTVAAMLEPGGVVVLDDFTPSTTWPPLFEGRVDSMRQQWLTDERFTTVEVMVTDDASVLIASRR